MDYDKLFKRMMFLVGRYDNWSLHKDGIFTHIYNEYYGFLFKYNRLLFVTGPNACTWATSTTSQPFGL